MQVTVNKLPQSEVSLEIEVSVEEIQPFLIKAANKISQDIKIEGFREGKAPFELIRQKIGDLELLKEALDYLIPEKLRQAIIDNDLEIAEQPKIEIFKMAPGNPASFKATFAVMPEVTLGDYSQVQITRETPKIKSEKSEQILQDLRKMRATESAVIRPVQKGDKLIVDIDMSVAGVPMEGGQGRDTAIMLGESYFLPGLDEQLLGLNPQEVKTFTLPYPKDHYDKKLAGQDVEFKVTVKNVLEVVLPELNEDFVKKLGQFGSVEELKTKINENLEIEEKDRLERKLENEIFDALVEKTTFETIPQALIDHEVSKMLRELEANINGEGMEFDTYLSQIKKTVEDLKTEFIKPAEKRVKIALALRELVRQEKIEATKEELDKEIDDLLKTCPPEDDKIRQQITSKDYRLYIEDIILNRKALDWLKKAMVKA